MVIAVVVGTLLLALELAAVPIATRVIGAVAARCVVSEHLELTAVDRPVLPRLLTGRARGVELRAEGVQAGELRIAEAHLDLPEALLPWAIGDPDPVPAVLTLRVTERDVQRALRAALPLRLPVEVTLDPDVATVGAAGVSLEVELALEVAADGTVTVRPGGGAGFLDRLGLATSFPPSDDVHVTAIDIGDGELSGVLELAVVPGLGDGEGCAEPLASGASPTG
ncbi:MAG: LmeA family phospholipid-binding protein [Nitriliruptor sp.]|uniref:LmeA family phospholipid-binding protein n=1 Tax=Nitriliruptor sp. TaxID=2448056 RepID=UPI0034A05027